MNSKAVLRVAPCDYKAASYAVKNWHYSECMPSGKLILFGVWEDGRYRGAVMFGRGAIHHIGKPFGVTQAEICELVRVALSSHVNPVSRIMAICLRMLRQTNPGMRAVVSYADAAQGHHGGIYQATNWVYVGAKTAPHVVIHNVTCHPRSVNAKYGTWSIPWLRKNVDANAHLADSMPKHKYVMPLDADMALTVESMRRPYPKRATSIGADAPGDQPGEGGSQPTVALQNQAIGSGMDEEVVDHA